MMTILPLKAMASSPALYSFLRAVAACLAISAIQPASVMAMAGDPSAAGQGGLLCESRPRLLLDNAYLQRLKKIYNQSPELSRAISEYADISKVPVEKAFLTDATDGQRQGLWRLPNLAMDYLMAGDQDSLERAVGFLELLNSMPEWETGDEANSGMSAGNIMVGAAIAFDWLYNELDPEFREVFQQKLWRHANLMYELGHLAGNSGGGYWRADPQNNHRWHRNVGMALCAFASYDGSPGQDEFIRKIRAELDFIVEWLPEDGTSHESPSYLVFGIAHLLLTVQAADKCLGTDYLANPFFEAAPAFRVQNMAPGFEEAFSYGDGDGVGDYNAAFFYLADHFKQDDVLAALEIMREKNPTGFGHHWMNLFWHGESNRGSASNLPRRVFFDDIGQVIVRDGWERDNVAMMFKCGPLGGYLLNKYRDEENLRYVNVAHDDPDANSFVIWTGGAFVAETDRYSKHKQSSNHNTVLINGVGQQVAGQGEGNIWSQPATGESMREMAYVTAWTQRDEIAVMEGEAAGAYHGAPLERFRRTVIWNEGKYILVLDDLRASEDVTFNWLMQGPELEQITDRRFRLSSGDASCEFVIVATAQLKTGIRPSTADHQGKPLGWSQLRADASAKTLRVASLYLPWGGQGEISLSTEDADNAVVEVVVNGQADDWNWRCATSAMRSSSLVLRRDGKNAFTLKPQRVTLPYENQ